MALNLWKARAVISDTRDKQLSITYLQHELTWERKLISKEVKSENKIWMKIDRHIFIYVYKVR